VNRPDRESITGGWSSTLPDMPAASMAVSGPGNMTVVGASVPIRTA
jgi:hypothetical protein